MQDQDLKTSVKIKGLSLKNFSERRQSVMEGEGLVSKPPLSKSTARSNPFIEKYEDYLTQVEDKYSIIFESVEEEED